MPSETWAVSMKNSCFGLGNTYNVPSVYRVLYIQIICNSVRSTPCASFSSFHQGGGWGANQAWPEFWWGHSTGLGLNAYILSTILKGGGPCNSPCSSFHCSNNPILPEFLNLFYLPTKFPCLLDSFPHVWDYLKVGRCLGHFAMQEAPATEKERPAPPTTGLCSADISLFFTSSGLPLSVSLWNLA